MADAMMPDCSPYIALRTGVATSDEQWRAADEIEALFDTAQQQNLGANQLTDANCRVRVYRAAQLKPLLLEYLRQRRSLNDVEGRCLYKMGYEQLGYRKTNPASGKCPTRAERKCRQAHTLLPWVFGVIVLGQTLRNLLHLSGNGRRASPRWGGHREKHCKDQNSGHWP